jgi:N-methylhydantoinase B
LGVTYRFRVEADDLGWVNFGSGIHDETAPFGLQGGKPAPRTRQFFVRKEGAREEIDVNCFSKVEKGDICEMFTSGGGGFGDPYLRPQEKVLDDVINGVVSLEKAEADYGVVIDAQSLTIDREATERLRKGMQG